jgi:Asp-tRNA(Asn)/Glu-tRNA(Gln) amidotransferase A subunit family amidase
MLLLFYKEEVTMKIMISQPMRGKTNEQIRNEREELVKQLEKQGHEVVDTVFDKAPKGVDEAVYFLSKSIEFISKVDGLIFMPGWDKARGCIIEHQVASAYGKFIKYQIS